MQSSRAFRAWQNSTTGEFVDPVNYTVTTGYFYSVTQAIVDGYSHLAYALAAPLLTDSGGFNCRG